MRCQLISATPTVEFKQREEAVSGVLFGAEGVNQC